MRTASDMTESCNLAKVPKSVTKTFARRTAESFWSLATFVESYDAVSIGE